jgi:hypothetical protein
MECHSLILTGGLLTAAPDHITTFGTTVSAIAEILSISRDEMLRIFGDGYYTALNEAASRFPDAFWYLGTWEAMTNPGEIMDVCRWLSENNGECGEVFLPITRRKMPWFTTVEMKAILQAYPSNDDLFDVLPPMTGISAHRYLPDTISEIDLCIWLLELFTRAVDSGDIGERLY